MKKKDDIITGYQWIKILIMLIIILFAWAYSGFQVSSPKTTKKDKKINQSNKRNELMATAIKDNYSYERFKKIESVAEKSGIIPLGKKITKNEYLTMQNREIKENLAKHKRAWALSDDDEIENLKSKVSSLEDEVYYANEKLAKVKEENKPVYYGTKPTTQKQAITYTPEPASTTSTDYFAEPVKKSSTWSMSERGRQRLKQPYPGMVRINSTTYMKPNAYGPGVGMNQYGQAVKVVPAN